MLCGPKGEPGSIGSLSRSVIVNLTAKNSCPLMCFSVKTFSCFSVKNISTKYEWSLKVNVVGLLRNLTTWNEVPFEWIFPELENTIRKMKVWAWFSLMFRVRREPMNKTNSHYFSIVLCIRYSHEVKCQL